MNFTTSERLRAAAPTRLVTFAATPELQAWLEQMQKDGDDIGDAARSVLEHVMQDDKAHADGVPMQWVSPP